jgi:hypothetical protein
MIGPAQDNVTRRDRNLNFIQRTGDYENVSKVVQIRNVPDDLHRTLKKRAARESMSLSDFLKRELERTAARSRMTEWLGPRDWQNRFHPG